ncbi:hypothetical protein EHV15_29485 [Paenibacillus oralis]|uniref:Uncharacterized protein n=1 Tax=Paenibacillus oralis TaxID=2490856 RepID=A0A3P3UAL1_9BACL|nr:hypothetical protein [Paenibacillus oralis]RRJ66599.1 hypothetical protein EHV15_29485 [Paenibacillus oralis]
MRRYFNKSPVGQNRKKGAGWAVILAAAVLLALVSACSLAPDRATMDKQAKGWPWSFGASVSDEVYSPTITEDVYSTE